VFSRRRQTNVAELFRFAALRSPQSVGADLSLNLDAGSVFQRELAAATREARTRGKMSGAQRAAIMAPAVQIANTYLTSADFVPPVGKLHFGSALADMVDAVAAKPPATLADFINLVTKTLGATVQKLAEDASLTQDETRLRDSLVAAYLSPEGHTVTMTTVAGAVRAIDMIRRAAKNDPSLGTKAGLVEALNRPLALPATAFPRDPNAIEPIGVADLLVVRQHIKQYVQGEVQNIENILLGESRRKTRHHTLTSDKTTTIDTSSTTETTQEQTTTTRFDLKNEIDKTLKEDLAIKVGTSVAYHGGTVDASVNFGLDYATSKTDSQKVATDYAKEVTARAASKVTDTTRQQLIQKLTDTIETIEDHTFDDTKGPANVSGVYQWLEKVYTAQVFNYGKRTLYDLIVPEPAAQWLEAFLVAPSSASTPEVPPTFDADVTKITPDGYLDLVKKFRADGVPAPPQTLESVGATLTSTKSQSGNDPPTTLKIPAGYEAVSAYVSGNYDYTDQANNGLGVYLGDNGLVWKQNMAATPVNFVKIAGGEIPFGVHPYNISDYTVTIRVICNPSADSIAKWKAAVFDKLLMGWRKWQSDYEDALTKAAQDPNQTPDRGFGGSIDENRTVARVELKRSLLEMMIGEISQPLIEPNPSTGNPTWPHPAMPASVQKGELIRFFELAFEWEQISYVFFPYFWGRKNPFWYDKLRLHSGDAAFQDFLRAGSARVVLPVRLGFEAALQYYFVTGQVWGGGDPPQVNDPNYIPITQEIRELSGAPGSETPYGTPWDIVLPTDLIKLRADDKTPVWTQPDPSKWIWKADDGSISP
jgi:hypothetical protein